MGRAEGASCLPAWAGPRGSEAKLGKGGLVGSPGELPLCRSSKELRSTWGHLGEEPCPPHCLSGKTDILGRGRLSRGEGSSGPRSGCKATPCSPGQAGRVGGRVGRGLR